MTKISILPSVQSLGELRNKSGSNSRYARLMQIAAENLGGPFETLEKAYQTLVNNANETSIDDGDDYFDGEEGVIEEINNVRDIELDEARKRKVMKEKTVVAVRVKTVPKLPPITQTEYEDWCIELEACQHVGCYNKIVRPSYKWCNQHCMNRLMDEAAKQHKINLESRLIRE